MELVSIITPSYNSSKFIAETIESILAQTYTNWELLITDDCSTDNSVEIISKYAAQDNRIRIFYLEKKSGAGFARNKSIQEAKGRFIAFCDSDDLWKPNKLEKQITFMMDNKVGLSYSNYDVINENGVFQREIVSPPKVDYYKMLKNDYIGCLTVVYDTTLVGEIFIPPVERNQDWILWLNILKKGSIASNVNDNLAMYRKRKNSLSSDKFVALKCNWKVYREYENFSFINSCFHIIRYVIYYLIKNLTMRCAPSISGKTFTNAYPNTATTVISSENFELFLTDKFVKE